MSYDKDNIFAKILRGEIPCDKVYENEYVLAFNDIGPQAPTHVLVIPKGEYVSQDDFTNNATPEEITGLWRAVGYIARDVLDLADAGYRTIQNTGADGGQEVPHYHVHILGGAPIGRMVCK